MPVQRQSVLVALLLSPFAFLFAFLSLQAREALPRPVPEPIARPADNLAWSGVGSCAASACHGSLDKGASEMKSAVTIWTRDDPHARAYFTLRGERSKKMLANLRRLDTPAGVRPETEPLCLKCHAASVPDELQGPKFDATEGVGCESCHGPSGKWKVIHDLPSWKALSDNEKAGFGMRALRNPAVRADACAGCHQGSPDREVNHDLIAAGHPALFFDVSAQMDRLPRHWDRSIDRQVPDFSARLWVAGQLMGARLSMENLEARAKNANKPWPEFAEHDCLACHRNARLDPLPPVKGVLRGQAPYLAWHQPMTSVLASVHSFADHKLLESLAQLTTLMNEPLPDRAAVAKKAAEVRGQLDGMLGKVEGTGYDKNDLVGLMRAIATENAKHPNVRWYTGVQVASGLTALNKALVELDPTTPRGEVEAALRKLQERFPPPIDGGWRRQPTNPGSIAPLLTPLLDHLR